MKSLLSSDIAAQAPSSTMIMKKTFPLLRVIGLSAGLVASAAMMPSVHAATSGTISATGTIVAGVCNVTGGSVSLYPVGTNTSLESDQTELAGGTYDANSLSTTISLSPVSLVAPAGASNLAGAISARFYDELSNEFDVINTNLTTGGSVTIYQDRDPLYHTLITKSGYYYLTASVSKAGAGSLPAGNYSLTSTITCLAQ